MPHTHISLIKSFNGKYIKKCTSTRKKCTIQFKRNKVRIKLMYSTLQHSNYEKIASGFPLRNDKTFILLSSNALITADINHYLNAVPK